MPKKSDTTSTLNRVQGRCGACQLFWHSGYMKNLGFDMFFFDFFRNSYNTMTSMEPAV